MYDITKKETFDNLPKWIKEINDQAEQDCVLAAVGNKCDLNQLRQVEVEKARQFAEKNRLPFMETSALDATNVEKAFSTLLIEIYKKKRPSVGGNSGPSTAVNEQFQGPSAIQSIKLESAKPNENVNQPANAAGKACAC